MLKIYLFIIVLSAAIVKSPPQHEGNPNKLLLLAAWIELNDFRTPTCTISSSVVDWSTLLFLSDCEWSYLLPMWQQGYWLIIIAKFVGISVSELLHNPQLHPALELASDTPPKSEWQVIDCSGKPQEHKF